MHSSLVYFNPVDEGSEQKTTLSMDKNKQAYNIWAEQYDTNNNKTRDAEGIALRKTLDKIVFDNVLEIGCGTGKNSEWFIKKATEVVAVDFSDEMLKKAKTKIKDSSMRFLQADITEEWTFTNKKFDLVSFSLVLEHIKDLDFIFGEVSKKTNDKGYVYIGELHPFKQYSGSLARFDTEKGRVELDCYIHNISDFFKDAKKHGFSLVKLNEWFDGDDETVIPRILSLLFCAC